MRLERRRGLGGERRTGTAREADRAGRAPAAALAAALRRSRGRWIQTAIVALLCFWIGYFLSAALLFPSSEGERPATLVEVPRVVGLAAEEAERRLTEAGLTASLEGVQGPDTEPGTVVAQSPLPDQLAPAGEAVRVAVAAGPEVRAVPELRGLSPRAAVVVLEGLGFRVRTREVADTTGRGGVQGSRPAAGERVRLPAEVELLVAEARRLVVVPELRGLHVEDVERVLAGEGLALGTVRYDPEAAHAPGRVVVQSPPAGYSLRAGGTVSVEVAGNEPGEGGG